MRVLTILLALTLAGCGSAQRERLAEIDASVKAAIATCDARYPARGQRTAWARCVGEAERPLIESVPVANRDLFELKSANRLALSARIDRGEISDEDARLEFAKINSHVMAELERRSLARRSVAAQENAAAGVTCTRFGNTVSCY